MGDYSKEQRNVRLHAKDFKRKQKHKEKLGREETSTKPKPIKVAEQPTPKELPPEEDDTKPETGLDFETLISQPTSSSSGFVFSNEKSWDKNVELATKRFEKYFEIDVDRLSLAMSTIPFDQRFEAVKDVKFDLGLLEKYRTDAERQSVIYETEKRKWTVPNGVAEEKKPAKIQRDVVLPKSRAVPDVPVVQIEESKEDIQNWLDNVLDI